MAGKAVHSEAMRAVGATAWAGGVVGRAEWKAVWRAEWKVVGRAEWKAVDSEAVTEAGVVTAEVPVSGVGATGMGAMVD